MGWGRIDVVVIERESQCLTMVLSHGAQHRYSSLPCNLKAPRTETRRTPCKPRDQSFATQSHISSATFHPAPSQPPHHHSRPSLLRLCRPSSCPCQRRPHQRPSSSPHISALPRPH